MLNQPEISVLIIEDNSLDYFLFSEYSKDLELVLDKHHKKTLGQAISFLKNGKKHTSIIFSDLNLPDGNGIEIIDELKKHVPKTIPIVFLTGLASKQIENEINNSENFSLLLKDNLNTDSLSQILNTSILKGNIHLIAS